MQIARNTSVKNRLKTTLKYNLSGWLLMFPSIVLFYFVVWRPVATGAIYSLFNMEGYNLAEFVGLKNYMDVIKDADFLKTLANTFKYAFFSLLIGFPLPIIAAIILNEMVHFKRSFKFILYFPAIIPGIAISMLWYYIFLPDQSGLLNMMLALFGKEPFTWLQEKSMTIPLIITSMTWGGMGGTTIMYLANLQSVSQELYDASVIDGAGFFSKLRYVLIPHIRGLALLLLVRQFIGVFQVMEQPLAMTGGGPNGASLSLALQTYNYAFVYYHFDKALALGMITFLMLMCLTVAYFVLDKKLSE